MLLRSELVSEIHANMARVVVHYPSRQTRKWVTKLHERSEIEIGVNSFYFLQWSGREIKEAQSINFSIYFM